MPSGRRIPLKAHHIVHLRVHASIITYILHYKRPRRKLSAATVFILIFLKMFYNAPCRSGIGA